MTPAENLVMQKCRPRGASPRHTDARPEDYFYTVVAVWLEPKAHTVPDTEYRLMCAVVAEMTGGSNVLPFLDLEFSDIE